MGKDVRVLPDIVHDVFNFYASLILVVFGHCSGEQRCLITERIWGTDLSKMATEVLRNHWCWAHC